MSEYDDRNDALRASGMRLLATGRADRLRLLKEMGKARSSLVISYFTSFREGPGSGINDQDIRVIERHIIKAKSDGVKAVDIFLCTTGGTSTFPWDFLAMFREHMPDGRLGVIVPYWAYSAGSCMALGADEIVMSPSGVLGPVDSQVPIRGQYGMLVGSRILNSYRNFLQRLTGGRTLRPRQLLQAMNGHCDPIIIGTIHKAALEDERTLRAALAARRRPLSDRLHQQICEHFLDRVGFHGQGIRRTEARKAGVAYITDSEKTGVDAQISDLFSRYADVLKLFQPFELGDNDHEVWHGGFDAWGIHTSHTPVILIESQYDTNPAYAGTFSERHWDGPPPIGPFDPTASEMVGKPLYAAPDRQPNLIWMNKSRIDKITRQEQ